MYDSMVERQKLEKRQKLENIEYKRGFEDALEDKNMILGIFGIMGGLIGFIAGSIIGFIVGTLI